MRRWQGMYPFPAFIRHSNESETEPWYPLRGEWVAYASHRPGRTFLAMPEYNPLAPS